jgi:hypothetical protein
MKKKKKKKKKTMTTVMSGGAFDGVCGGSNSAVGSERECRLLRCRLGK